MRVSTSQTKAISRNQVLASLQKACIYVYILNTIVLDSRDQHKKIWHPTFLHLHNMPHNTPYLKKLTKMHWLHYNAKQKHLSHKKVQGQSKATYVANRHVRPKTLISTKAKKLLSQNYF